MKTRKNDDDIYVNPDELEEEGDEVVTPEEDSIQEPPEFGDDEDSSNEF